MGRIDTVRLSFLLHEPASSPYFEQHVQAADRATLAEAVRRVGIDVQLGASPHGDTPARAARLQLERDARRTTRRRATPRAAAAAH